MLGFLVLLEILFGVLLFIIQVSINIDSFFLGFVDFHFSGFEVRASRDICICLTVGTYPIRICFRLTLIAAIYLSLISIFEPHDYSFYFPEFWI